MEKEFSEFNGYPIKDLVARAEIEKLKQEALKYKIVTELPTENIQENTIYLVPIEGGDNNRYREWFYINGKWEDFGTHVEIDLSGYVEKPAKSDSTNRILAVEAATSKTLAWYANPVYIYSVDSYGQVVPLYKKVGKAISNASSAPAQTIYVATPQLDYEAANKKYVDDTAVKRVTGTPSVHSVYGYNSHTKKDVNWNLYADASGWTIPIRNDDGQFKVGDLTESSDPSYVANKKYVDEQIQALKTQLGI